MARRKYTYKYNLFTGQKEKVLKSGYYKDPFTGQVKKSVNYSFGKSSGMHYQRRRPMTREEQKLLFIIIFIAFIMFIFYKVGIWISTHIVESILFGAILIGGGIFLFWKVPFFNNMLQKKIKIFTNVQDQEIKDLINLIEGIKVQDVRNEEDFEKQIYQRLDAKGYTVERQVHIGATKKIDLIVDKRIGLELKIADRSKNVQDLIGQVTIYHQYLQKILVIILDIGIVPDIQEYINHIKNVNPKKISVVTIKGPLRRYQKREEYFTVKKTTTRY